MAAGQHVEVACAHLVDLVVALDISLARNDILKYVDMAVEVPSVILPVDEIPLVRIGDTHLLDAKRPLVFRMRVLIGVFFGAEAENNAVFVVSFVHGGCLLSRKKCEEVYKIV